MSLLRNKFEEKFKPISFKNLKKTVRVLKQVGKSDKRADALRKALLPGKRISKNGNVYWETRKNRSDVKGSNI